MTSADIGHACVEFLKNVLVTAKTTKAGHIVIVIVPCAPELGKILLVRLSSNVNY